jgi:uncharacterized protein YgiM (DUF1202 family)
MRVQRLIRDEYAMWLLLTVSIVLQCFIAANVQADDEFYKVVVAEAYMEMHTGAGRGYPVFHVVSRGDEVEVIKRRTDWFLVRTSRGKEGWVSRAEMELTVTQGGEKTMFAESAIGDFSRRRWEGGVLAGDFDGADMITVYGAYAMTQNFSAELSVSQVFGDYSDGVIGRITLVAQPFPEWRLSPFFSLGGGLVYTDPNVTLVDESDRTDEIASAGVGIRMYLTRRFIVRAEYKNNVIFQDKDDNQEINEWKAGFAFFF